MLYHGMYQSRVHSTRDRRRGTMMLYKRSRKRRIISETRCIDARVREHGGWFRLTIMRDGRRITLIDSQFPPFRGMINWA